MRKRKFGRREQRWYLTALRELGGQSVKAAQAIGYPKYTISRAMELDQVFACEAEDIITEIGEDLLKEGIRRARGFKQDIFYHGEKVGEDLIYSDTLLVPLLKGLLPDRFVEKSEVKITGTMSFAKRLKECLNGNGNGERISGQETD